MTRDPSIIVSNRNSAEHRSPSTGTLIDWQMVRYTLPRPSKPGAESSKLRLVNLLLIARLRTEDGIVVCGYGEAELRDKYRPDAMQKKTWRKHSQFALQEVLSSITGADISLLNPADAIESIAGVLTQTRSSQRDVAAQIPSSCWYAVETAILDSVARVMNLKVSELISAPGQRPYTPVSVEGIANRTAARQMLFQNSLRFHSEETAPSKRAKSIGLAAASQSRPSPLNSLAPATVFGPQQHTFIVTETSPTPLSIAAATHLAAASNADLLVAGVEHESVKPAPINGPGLGVSPDWKMILTTPGVSYFSTGNLQSAFERPVNVYANRGLSKLGPNGAPAQAMTYSALATGMTVTRYAKGSFVAATKNGDRLPFVMSRTQLSGIAASSFCNHKEVTRLLLRQAGVPTPEGRTFGRGHEEAAVAYAEQIGFPVVLKPAMGFRGIGVFAGIENTQELWQALSHLRSGRLGHQDFIVEKHIFGEEYRIIVVGDRAVAAIRRVPASVVGDGTHTLAELILRKNALRRQNPSLRYRPIKYDADAEIEMSHQGVTLTTIPDAGKTIVLSSTSNLSQGGDSIDVLDDLHPTILEASVAATKAIPELGFAGVDFMVEDPKSSLEHQTAAILEMNAHASISGAVFPMYGQPRQISDDIVELLLDRLAIDTVRKPDDLLAVQIVVRGKLSKVGYEEWIAELAEETGLVGWVRQIKQRSFEIVAQGCASDVATMSIAAVLGPKQASPTSATTVHIFPTNQNRFCVVSEQPEGVHLAL